MTKVNQFIKIPNLMPPMQLGAKHELNFQSVIAPFEIQKDESLGFNSTSPSPQNIRMSISSSLRPYGRSMCISKKGADGITTFTREFKAGDTRVENNDLVFDNQLTGDFIRLPLKQRQDNAVVYGVHLKPKSEK
jgi:hypothetical protein